MGIKIPKGRLKRF